MTQEIKYSNIAFCMQMVGHVTFTQLLERNDRQLTDELNPADHERHFW